jgi:hypothetical protein
LFLLHLVLPVYGAEVVINEEILQTTEIGRGVLQLCNEAIDEELLPFTTTAELLKAESETANGTCYGEAMQLIHTAEYWQKQGSLALELVAEHSTVIALQTLHQLQVRLLNTEGRYDPELGLARTKKQLDELALKNSEKIKTLHSLIREIDLLPTTKSYKNKKQQRKYWAKIKKNNELRLQYINQIYKLGKSNDRMLSNFEQVIKPKYLAWTTSSHYLQINKLSAEKYSVLEQLLTNIEERWKALLKSSSYELVQTEVFYCRDEIQAFFSDLVEATHDKNSLIQCVYYPLDSNGQRGHMMLIDSAHCSIYSIYSPTFSYFSRLDEPLFGLMHNLMRLDGQWGFNFFVYKPKKEQQ